MSICKKKKKQFTRTSECGLWITSYTQCGHQCTEAHTKNAVFRSTNNQPTQHTVQCIRMCRHIHTAKKKLERNNEYGLYWWNSLTAFCAFHWRTSLSASNTQTQSTLKSYAWNTCYRERDFIIVYVYMNAYKKRGSDSNHCLDIFIRITWLNWIASQKC